jgi:hypothetical protein
LERSNHPAHAQYLDGIVCHLLQPDGHRHHRIYYPGKAGNATSNLEANPTDAINDCSSTEDAGDSRAL